MGESNLQVHPESLNAFCKSCACTGAESVSAFGKSPLSQGRHVYHETIFNIAFQQALIGFIDLLNGNNFDI